MTLYLAIAVGFALALAVLAARARKRPIAQARRNGTHVLASATSSSGKMRSHWNSNRRELQIDLPLASLSKYKLSTLYRADVSVWLQGVVLIPLNPSEERRWGYSLVVQSFIDSERDDDEMQDFTHVWMVNEFYFGNGLSFYKGDAEVWSAEYPRNTRCIATYFFDYVGKGNEKLKKFLSKEWLAQVPDIIQVKTAGSMPFNFSVEKRDVVEWSERFPSEFLKFEPPDSVADGTASSSISNRAAWEASRYTPTTKAVSSTHRSLRD